MKGWKLLTLVGLFAWAWTSASHASRPRSVSPGAVKAPKEPATTRIPVSWMDEQKPVHRYLQ